jgi:hypothetical protein
MGQSAYLEMKVEGENSMSMKRRAMEGGYVVAPQDPRDMVRALLPEPQFPAMQYHVP